MAGNIDEAVGAGKEKVGEVTGNEDLEAEGKGQKWGGKVAQAGDKVADTAQELGDRISGGSHGDDGTA